MKNAIAKKYKLSVVSKSLLLAFGLVLFGCDAKGDKSDITNTKNRVTQEDLTSDSAESKQKIRDAVLEQYQPLDGFAQSLEPLEEKHCFGEKHSKEAVAQLLDEMYPEAGYPITGMGVLLGADTHSIASKNKEFRYVFNSPVKEEEAIKEAVLPYIQEFLDLIDFKLREYPITDRDTPPKDLASQFDLPALIIENPGTTAEELEKYEAYFMRYAQWLDEYTYDSLKEKNLEIYREIQDFRKFNSEKKQTKKIYGSYVSGGGYDYSMERFLPIKLNGGKLLYEFLHHYYTYKKENITSLGLEHDLSVDIIYASIAIGFYGTLFQVNQSSIDTLIDKQNVSQLEQGKEELKPYPFDKSLFLAVYDRIKPVHMSKRNYIEAVLTVMKPCLY